MSDYKPQIPLSDLRYIWSEAAVYAVRTWDGQGNYRQEVRKHFRRYMESAVLSGLQEELSRRAKEIDGLRAQLATAQKWRTRWKAMAHRKRQHHRNALAALGLNITYVRELQQEVKRLDEQVDGLRAQLAAPQAATLSAQSVAVIREAILVRYENSGDAYWPLLDKAKEEFRALTQYPAQKPTHADPDRGTVMPVPIDDIEWIITLHFFQIHRGQNERLDRIIKWLDQVKPLKEDA